MATAEELLSGAAHAHDVVDSDTYFIIDPVTRQIDNTTRKKKTIMQRDHRSEVFTFELARYVEGHDMSLCNRVKVHWNNIDGETGEENAETTDITDLHVSGENEDVVICTWTVTRNSTQLVGILSFLVQYQCVDDAGVPTYEWHTDSYDEIQIKATRNNGEASVIEYSDILEQWRVRIFGAGDSVIANIGSVSDEKIAAIQAEAAAQTSAIEAKGAATLATIPEDYTTVSDMAKEAIRSKADAIAVTVQGETIIVDNSSDDYLRGLHIYGKTVQDGIPSPTEPKDLINVTNPLIGLYGRNLIDIEQIKLVGNKTIDISDDKYTITITGGSDKTYAYSYYNMPEDLVKVLGGKCLRLTSDSITKSVSTAYSPVQLNITCSDGTVLYPVNHDSHLSHDLNLPKDVVGFRIGIYTNNSSTLLETDNTVVVKGLRLTLVDMPEYEPYKGYQTLTLTRTLPGIPVTSGGNYTDSNGQQWICDEIDFERGVYIQRITEFIADETLVYEVSSTTNPNGSIFFTLLHKRIGAFVSDTYMPLCENRAVRNNAATMGLDEVCVAVNSVGSHMCIWFCSDVSTVDEMRTRMGENPSRFLLPLAEPIETPLTAEELLAFRELYTNHLNTTILNDAGAWMNAKYNADTKTYVENPKTLRLTDTSTGVVYELKVVDGSLIIEAAK